MEKRYAVVDMETTTTNIQKGKIIQFSCAFLYKGKVEHVFNTYLNPEEKLDDSIIQLTGIDQQTVNQAPLFIDIAPYIYQLLQDCVFVAHNVNFDFRFLNHAFESIGLSALTIDAIDTVELSQILLPTMESYRLSDLTAQLEIEHDHPHQADSDACATAHLLIYLSKVARQLPLPLLKHLLKYREVLSFQTGDWLQEQYQVAKQSKQYLPNDLTVIAGIVLKKPKEVVPDYSDEKWTIKEAQQEMIDFIHHMLDEKLHAAILEAPTGTGKTLGYLNAYEGNYSKEKPLVISTSTVHLQEQLLDAIPYLNRMTHANHRATLIKSTSHYINLDAFYHSLKDTQTKTIRLLQMRLLTWLSQTETGDLSELNLTVQQHPYWQQIRHAGLQYVPKRSPFYKVDFLYRRQEAIQESDILILNHAMLLQEKHLYEKSHFIIDEAHQMMSTFIENQWHYYPLQWIQKVRKQLLDPEPLLLSKEDQQLWGRRGVWLTQGIDRYALTFRQLKDLLLVSDFDEESYFILQDLLQATSNIHPLIEELISLGEELITIINQCLPFIFKAHNKKNHLQYFHDTLNALSNYLAGMTAALKKESENLYVLGFHHHQLCIIELPKHQGSLLNMDWYQASQSVLFVGGTILVNHKADYFIKQLGLENIPVKVLNEVFDYKQQSHLYVLNDSTTHAYYSEEELLDFIRSITQRSHKKMMCLFTSQERMLYCAEHLQLQERPIFYPKVKGSHYKVLKQFKDSKDGILLGTQSFWEGIDLPGEHLECLMIEKLPFASMNQLFYYAQSFRYQDKKNQLFKEILLPDMILKLRQGLGRLIRTSHDTGTMIILDRRVLHSSYASYIQQSLPESLPITEGNRKKVLSIFEKE